MASWQAHLLVPLLKLTIKRRLRAGGDVETARKVLGGRKPRVSREVSASNETIGGVDGEWSRPRGQSPVATMLYLHGGGYAACSPQTHRPITNAFAKAGFAVFALDYRLAPGHPFPAAIEDAVAVYRALLARGIGPEHLVVAGDSSGGGLALALLLKLRDLGEPLPAASMLFSPWTDLACTGASISANGKSCAMFDGDILRRGAAVYLAGADPRTPLASPLYADLHGLPALRIHVSGAETLLSDSTRFLERARAAGVPCGLRQWPSLPHDWQLMRILPEAAESIEIAADFLKGAVTAGAKARAG
ncbi:MAG: alpha/beta hydrolase [Beijerinckiaceae bacterium]|jgi:acetyl esterase/lipase